MDTNKDAVATGYLPYKFCPFDGAVLAPAIQDGWNGWKCPEDECPYFKRDDNASVSEGA